MLTWKFLKNEIVKILYSKKTCILLIFVLFMIGAICYMMHLDKLNIINGVPKTKRYSTQLRMEILNMNSIVFLKLFSTEFVFRTVVPYFVFFMVVVSVEIFGEDFFSGNMKYFIRLSGEKGQLFKAKVLAVIFYSFSVVAVTFLLGFVISSLVFALSFHGFFRIMLIYLSAVVPVASFGLIIGLMSMFIRNKNVSITIGIVLSIFLTVSDRLTITSSFSPIGVLGLMEKVRADNVSLISLLMADVTSAVYLEIAYFAGRKIFKMKEFNC